MTMRPSGSQPPACLLSARGLSALRAYVFGVYNYYEYLVILFSNIFRLIVEFTLSAVYKTVLKHGDETAFDEMLGLFRAADLHEERERIQSNLGSVR
jgi:hypothetical protein